ncbi:hypothetical protein ALC60_04944 [Trachymyrmex zeteki]|uniref:Histone-lysine N-methyltransferase SETMAR n=1 Tax=Mycetomoellerius zeteki TaxID=64791 RepID=A0A151X6X3_9HYME|nr:hypothetical protein ALC60_04944 [Trachymyrmex zeteki]
MGILDIYVIESLFFLEDINITAEIYSIFLVETLPYLLEDVPLVIIPNIIFQQDGHPAHSSLLAQTVLNQKFPNRLIGIHSTLQEWPPCSPDLTPVDFFVCYIRDQVHDSLPRNRNDLIQKIQKQQMKK